MKLEANTTHFQCAACSLIKLTKFGQKVKVGHSVLDKNSQDLFQFTPHWVILCNKCCREAGNNK